MKNNTLLVVGVFGLVFGAFYRADAFTFSFDNQSNKDIECSVACGGKEKLFSKTIKAQNFDGGDLICSSGAIILLIKDKKFFGSGQEHKYAINVRDKVILEFDGSKVTASQHYVGQSNAVQARDITPVSSRRK